MQSIATTISKSLSAARGLDENARRYPSVVPDVCNNVLWQIPVNACMWKLLDTGIGCSAKSSRDHLEPASESTDAGVRVDPAYLILLCMMH